MHVPPRLVVTQIRAKSLFFAGFLPFGWGVNIPARARGGEQILGFRVWLYTPPRIRKAEVVLACGWELRVWVRPISVIGGD